MHYGGGGGGGRGAMNIHKIEKLIPMRIRLYELVLCKLIPMHIYKAQVPMEIDYYALCGVGCRNEYIFKKSKN